MKDIEKINASKQIAQELIKFSFPLIMSGILQQLYNWVDAFIIGNVEGDLALAAIGATTTVINFYINAITGFSLGLTILLAQKSGQRNYEQFNRVLSMFTMILGGIFTVASIGGIIFVNPVLYMLHTTGDTFMLAKDYLRIILAGIPVLAVYNVYSAALRGTGDSKSPFYSVLVSSIINIGLDILFVAVLHWNVTGAAIATVISQAVMTIFLIIYGMKKHSHICFKVKWDLRLLKEGCKFGIPPMLQSSISSAGNLILQRFMNGFGTYTVTAITTAYRVDSIIMLPIINLGSGISTMVAKQNGSGGKSKARQIFKIGTILMVGIALFLTALIIPFGGTLVSLFGASYEVSIIGKNFFHGLHVFILCLRL